MYEFINNTMRKAAEIMLEADDISSKVKAKPGDANFVTAYDVAVEKYLTEELTKQLPDASVIGEEEAAENTSALKGGLYFIIDPIDGTTNFIYGRRYSAISVGLCDRGDMVYGAIFNPYADRLYFAERGKGAFMTVKNKDTVKLSVQDKPLSKCLAAFGTSPYQRDRFGYATFDTAYKMFMRTLDIRRSGAASLDLASVASGTIDIFFEYSLSPWDFAAGSIVVEEAGGIITDMKGQKLDFTHPSSVLCGNRQAHEEWLCEIRDM